ncbi:hypothetical protein JCM11641_003135 [Rhodosporidiobolus odoratus]
MIKTTLYFDVVSPWTFFAFVVLNRYKGIWDMQLSLKPTMLGGVVAAAGNMPPLNVKNKGIWMKQHDLPLASEFFQIPYTLPDPFPLNSLHMMRLLRAIEEKYGQGPELDKAAEAFFAAVWQAPASFPASEAIKPANIPRTVSALFPPEDIKELLDLSVSAPLKAKMRKESEEVVHEKGSFGFPWMMIERDDGQKRSFFGSDRFEQMAFWLGKEWKGPAPAQQQKRVAAKL